MALTWRIMNTARSSKVAPPVAFASNMVISLLNKVLLVIGGLIMLMILITIGMFLGSRTDLTQIANDASTSTLQELVEKYPMHAFRYANGMRFVHSMLHKQQPHEYRTWRTRIIVIWGPSGTGKSRRMVDLLTANGNTSWIVVPRPPSGSGELTGYRGQKRVGLDDFYGWLPYDFLIRLGDNTPMPLRVLYGDTQWLADLLIITSNNHPSSWYPNHPIPYWNYSTREPSAWHRRLMEPGNEVIHMDQPTQEVLDHRRTHPLVPRLPPSAPAVSANYVPSSSRSTRSNSTPRSNNNHV